MSEDTGFDPADHTVAEVLEHLEGADPDERTRVLAAETDGQSRKGILSTVELREDCGRPEWGSSGICRQRLLHPHDWVCQRCVNVELPDVPRSPREAALKSAREGLDEALTDEQRAELAARREQRAARARRKTVDSSLSNTEPAEPVTTTDKET
jgi:hypothetical protein